MQQEITYIGHEGNIIQTADQDPYTHYLKQISATLAKKKKISISMNSVST